MPPFQHPEQTPKLKIGCGFERWIVRPPFSRHRVNPHALGGEVVASIQHIGSPPLMVTVGFLLLWIGVEGFGHPVKGSLYKLVFLFFLYSRAHSL